MKQIKVYGPGCKRCETAAKMMRDAADELGVAVAVEKVTDAKSIAMAGVMATPGIAIDGTLVHSGGQLSSDAVKAWLQS